MAGELMKQTTVVSELVVWIVTLSGWLVKSLCMWETRVCIHTRAQ